MKITIESIFALKNIFGGKAEITLPDGTDIKGLLSKMTEIWGDKLSPHLFQPDSSSLLPYVRLMVNGQVISFLDGLNTVLSDGDEVLILPMAAGG
jgi:molybdopterin converting factor small subunit